MNKILKPANYMQFYFLLILISCTVNNNGSLSFEKRFIFNTRNYTFMSDYYSINLYSTEGNIFLSVDNNNGSNKHLKIANKNDLWYVYPVRKGIYYWSSSLKDNNFGYFYLNLYNDENDITQQELENIIFKTSEMKRLNKDKFFHKWHNNFILHLTKKTAKIELSAFDSHELKVNIPKLNDFLGNIIIEELVGLDSSFKPIWKKLRSFKKFSDKKKLLSSPYNTKKTSHFYYIQELYNLILKNKNIRVLYYPFKNKESFYLLPNYN